jgi:hypothetical protein
VHCGWYGLVLEDGEPADPGVFVTAIPEWREGDEFLAGSELQRFRILAIDRTMDREEARNTFNAVWVVEPVDG